MKIPLKIYRGVGLQEMWDLQETFRTSLLATKQTAPIARLPGELWLVEHRPTLSLGRGEKGQNLYFPHEFIRQQGLDVVEVNRGGMVTYHGPGQLVAYPILDLHAFKLGIRDYVHSLEQTMIDTLQTWGIAATRREGAPGVYIGNKKIGSVGIHVRKGVTVHGLALNIHPNLQHFSWIRPCGLTDIEMTSVEKEGVAIQLPDTWAPFTKSFEKTFGCTVIAS